MNHAKMREWLQVRDLTLDESFVSILDGYVDDYKKKRSNHRADLCAVGY
jgi:hypothetical protein